MKSLLIKDLYNLKLQLILLLFFIVFVGFSAVMSGESLIFSLFGTMYMVIFPISTMAYDEKSKWDTYALAMPITRGELALSKYVLAILFGITTQIIGVAVLILSGSDWISAIRTAGTLLLIGMTMLSLSLPLLFKMGVERGRFVYYGALALPAGTVGFTVGMETTDMLINFITNAAGYIALGAVAVICVSMWLSCRIVEGKDL